MSYVPRCQHCNSSLWSDDELDFNTCNPCLESQYERSQAQQEWDYYHPGEPCPEIELPPGRGTSVSSQNPNEKPSSTGKAGDNG